MKPHALLAVVAGLLLASVARPDDDAAGKPEPVQGEWQLVSTQEEKHSDPGCDQSRMIVQANGGVVFQLAGQTLSQGTVEFGTSGKLRSLDLKPAGGQTLLAVYELKGDDLMICFAEAGKERPTGTNPKGTQWAETWKRVRR